MARKIIRPRSYVAPEAPPAAPTAPVAPIAEAPQVLVKTSARAVKEAKKAKEKPPATNRSAFIRSLPVAISAGDVVTKGADAGLTFRSNLVYEVRRAMKAKSGAPKGPGRPPKTSAVQHSHVAHTPKLGGLSSQERHLLGIVLEIGTRRASEILAELRAFGN